MAIQQINIGAAPNDKTGDKARVWAQKTNSNFTDPGHAASKIMATEAQAIAGTPGVIPDAEQVRKNHVAQVDTIEDLRALEPAFDGQQVSVCEGLIHSVFTYVPGSSASDDGASVLVTADGKRWVRANCSEQVNMTDFIPAEHLDGIKSYTSNFDCLDAFNMAKSKGQHIHFPAGSYYFSEPAVLPGGEFNGYILQNGFLITGDGESKTILHRGLTNASEQFYSDVEAEYVTQAVFNCHGMYHSIKDMTIERAKIGVFIGQDVSSMDDTYCSKLRFSSLVIRDCGAGILASVEKGIAYSNFEDLHIYRCQVGLRSRDGRWPSNLAPYFNRNKFKNIRFSRCWVGLWLARGDTNTFYSVDTEGMVADSNIANIPKPVGLPVNTPGLSGGLPTKSIGFVIEDAPYNRFFGSTMESTQVVIVDYNSMGVRNDNSYFGMLSGENTTDPDKFFFTQPPTTWISDRSFSNRFFTVGDSSYSIIDPEMGSGVINYKVPLKYLNPLTIYGGKYDTGAAEGGGILTKWQHLGNFAIAATKVFSFPPAQGNVNSFDSIEFELSVSDQVGRIGASLKGAVIVAYSNINNSAVRVRIDKTSLSGFSSGGGTVFDETNTSFITATASIDSGAVVLTFANLSGVNWTGSSISYKSTRVR